MAEQTGSHRQFLASLLVDGKECEGLLDTGASRTILTDDIVQPTRSSNRVLKAYTGGEIATLGMADVTIASPTRTMSCSCFVVPHGKHRILFGQDVISELELLVPAHLVDTGNLVDTAPISISVDAEARPVAQPARRPPFSAKADIEHELHRLVKADIIEPVKEASGWVSPIVPVRKSNGTLRLCVDYRQLNKSIVRERRSLPTIDEISDKLLLSLQEQRFFRFWTQSLVFTSSCLTTNPDRLPRLPHTVVSIVSNDCHLAYPVLPRYFSVL
eukprot:scpid38300/ scgid1508/ 